MTLCNQKEIHLSWGTCFLRYDMIASNLYNSYGNIIGEVYGVRVSLCDACDGRLVESREIPDITLFPSEMENLISALEDGQVTPYGLEDIIIDYLANQ